MMLTVAYGEWTQDFDTHSVFFKKLLVGIAKWIRNLHNSEEINPLLVFNGAEPFDEELIDERATLETLKIKDGDTLHVVQKNATPPVKIVFDIKYGRKRKSVIVHPKVKFDKIFKYTKIWLDTKLEKGLTRSFEYDLVKAEPWDLSGQVFKKEKIEDAKIDNAIENGDVVHVKPKPPSTDGVCWPDYEAKMREWMHTKAPPSKESVGQEV